MNKFRNKLKVQKFQILNKMMIIINNKFKMISKIQLFFFRMMRDNNRNQKL